MKATLAAASSGLAVIALLALPVATQQAAQPQDPKPVEQPDPELARIAQLIEQANGHSRAGKFAEARANLREALNGYLELPEGYGGSASQDLLWKLGVAAHGMGDLRSAHDALTRLCQQRSNTQSDDDPDLQEARGALGIVKAGLGDLAGAKILFEQVCEAFSRTLPDDHYELQRARLNLGSAQRELGDLHGALAIEQKVYDVFTRTLPPDHSDLQWSRMNLAVTKARLGDLHGARRLQEAVADVFSRTLPDDHPEVQGLRISLGATKFELGDLAGALALFESVFAVHGRTLPDDHPELQRVRLNLGVTKRLLGDLQGARVLQEKVYQVWKRALPEDHPDLQLARENLAALRRELGDLAGALTLAEQVYKVRSRTLTDLDHPLLQKARSNLSTAKHDLGDVTGALALAEEVYEVESRTLPDEHADLQVTRLGLGVLKRHIGDLTAALSLVEDAYGALSRTLPDDHPYLQRARRELAWTHAHLGNVAHAVRLAVERGRTTKRSLSRWALSPRELGGMAARESGALDLLLILADGYGELAPQPQLANDALLVSQVLRGIETRTTRLKRRARASDPSKTDHLERQLHAAIGKIARVTSEAVEAEGQEHAAKLAERFERLTSAVREKELLQRALVDLAAESGGIDFGATTCLDLAATLPERSAAVAIVSYGHAAPQPQHPGRVTEDRRLGALVLRGDAEVRWIPLGRVAELQPAIEEVRSAANLEVTRGRRPSETGTPNGKGLTSARERLGTALIGPVLSACEACETLFVTVDDLLELVPLDALPLSDEELVGDRVVIRPLASLFDLLEPTGAIVGEEPVLLAAGGLDYASGAEDAATTVDPNAAAPIIEHSKRGTWTPLPGTTREADGIAALFVEAFAEGKTEHLTGNRAGKAQLTAAAANATFVHVATHGYFAPESVTSTADAATGREIFAEESAMTGLSPLVLSGLALSGANLPPDGLGHHAGILTAEEILSLDLSRCYLVTLSACDTSLGVQRAGQGYASLRSALQGAGARYVLTSLWKVGDEATMELMVDFYRRLWKKKQDPHHALWEAKRSARGKGAAFHDWAGWILTGR